MNFVYSYIQLYVHDSLIIFLSIFIMPATSKYYRLAIHAASDNFHAIFIAVQYICVQYVMKCISVQFFFSINIKNLCSVVIYPFD